MAALRQAIALGLKPDRTMLESNVAELSLDADDVRAWFATATSSS